MTCLVVGDIYLSVTYYSLSAGIEGWIPGWASAWAGAREHLLHLPSDKHSRVTTTNNADSAPARTLPHQLIIE